MDLIGGLDAVTRELLLFAAFGFLVGGIDDLVVDLIYTVRRLAGRGGRRALGDFAAPSDIARLAILVPAWDEVAVIGPMLRAAVARIEHCDYRIYVGVYPNDRATIDAVAAASVEDTRVRLVIGPHPGPTTKGDNLNAIWRAVEQADREDGRVTRAVVLHDAEDVIHPLELRVFDSLLDEHAVVQLPVQPLIRDEARWISGLYADLFAEAHRLLSSLRARQCCQG